MFRLEIFTTLTIVKNRISAVIIKIIEVLGKYIDDTIIEWDGLGVDVMFGICILDIINIAVTIIDE